MKQTKFPSYLEERIWNGLKWSIATAFGFLITVSWAHSAVSENVSMGNAKAVGMAHSVTADPPGVDSVFYNPAGLTRIRKRRAQLNLLYLKGEFAVDFGEHSNKLSDCLNGISCPKNFSNDVAYDEAKNSSSSTSDTVVMLPQGGLTDVPVGLLPTGGVAIPVSENVTFATSVYSTISAGYKREDDDPGRFFAQQLALSRIVYFSPTFAFRLNDSWSFGLGVSFNYSGVALQLPMRLPHLLTVGLGSLQSQLGCSDGVSLLVDLCGGAIGPYTELIDLNLEVDDAMSVTYQAGVLWDITPWLSWGMVYRSGITEHLKGKAEIKYSENWQGFFGGLTDSGENGLASLLPSGIHQQESSDVVLDMSVPSYFSTGLSVQVTPRIKVNMDAKMSTWSDFEALTIHFENPDVDVLKLIATLDKVLELDATTSDSISIPLYFEDTWSWSIGMEYAYTNRLTLRMGYEDRRVSIPNERQTVLVPLSDLNVYALGFSYLLGGASEVDFAISIYKPKEEHVEAGASANSNSGEFNDVIYNPYAETDFTTKTTISQMVLSYWYEF